MRITYLTAGAGGMICGSCLHDNAMARALHARGHDVQLVPVYTPIRTDEVDFSANRVFLGGINIFLHQAKWLRWLPGWSTSWLDRPGVLRWATAGTLETSASKLGELAVSVLQGTHGAQRRDFDRLHRWIEADARPEVLVLSTLLIAGGIPALKARFQLPVVALLQGDDIFLEGLLEPYRSHALDRLKQIVPEIDTFVVHSKFYAEHMRHFLGIPGTKIQQAPLGVDFGAEVVSESVPGRPWKTDRFTVGYLARMAPEKGLQELCRAFVDFRRATRDQLPHARLSLAGWNGPQYARYVAESLDIVRNAGLGNELDFRGELSREAKFEFLRESVDLLCVPSPYREPKGLYALEAMGTGVPILAPAHGVFPELIELSQGGVLFHPNDIQDIAAKLEELSQNAARLHELGLRGSRYVRSHATIGRAAEGFEEILLNV
jgi:glycosyltransferase involved in cell wall biosynthesis